MPSLLIETSTERGMMALMDGDTILFQGSLPFGYQNSKYLIPEIDAGLNNLGLTIQQMTYIAAGVGPGSYTGMRVGAATAKTLAFASQRPLIGICTLKTFFPPHEGHFAVLIDAKIGGAYFIQGVRQGNQVTYTCEPHVLGIEHLGGLVRDCEIFLTPAAAMLRKKWELCYPDWQGTWCECGPDPVHMNRLASQAYDRKEYSTDGGLTLIYLRTP